MGSVRRLPSGRWELRVSIGRDLLSGKYRYKAKVVDAGDKRDARRQAIAWEAGLSDGRLSGEGGTFGQLCEEWIKHKARRWSPSTLEEHGGDRPHPRHRQADGSASRRGRLPTARGGKCLAVSVRAPARWR